jgi:hypothetical protein
MAVNGYFQVSARRQLVEMMTCNVWVDFEFLCDLGSSDT